MYLGIPMLIGIPVAYRTARLAAELNQRGFPPAPPEEQNIPAASADVIISEIKRSSPKPQSNKMVAQQTLQIFETINARPPGWAATFGLLFVHAASLAAAAIFAIAFLVVQRGDLRDIFANAASLPKHALECGPVPGWEGKQFAKDAAVSNDLIVATFSKPAEAGQSFQSIKGQLPDNCRLTQFGDTLLLSFPADDEATRKRWLHELQAHAKDVFVDSTNYHAAFSLLCIAPDQKAAAAIAGELENYLQTLPGLSLVPPWFAGDARPAAQKARDELARRTYLTLQNSQFDYFTNAELKVLQKNLMSAQKQGSRAEADDLRAQIKALTKKLSAERIEKVRSGAAGPVDARVAELFVTLMDDATATNRAAADAVRHELAEHFGQLPVNSPGARLTAQFGGVNRNALFIHVNWISFARLDEGPVALTTWLCSKGCIGMKYEFQPGLGGVGGEGDD
jgi:hypothetical protein